MTRARSKTRKINGDAAIVRHLPPPPSRLHKIGTMAADRERIAGAFEAMAKTIRAGRPGWAKRSVANGAEEIRAIPADSKVMPEMIAAMFEASGMVGIAHAAAISGLPPLDFSKVTIPPPTYVPADDPTPPCACVRFDDNGMFHLGSFAGGAARGGAFSFVSCVETTKDGKKRIHHYERTAITDAATGETIDFSKVSNG